MAYLINSPGLSTEGTTGNDFFSVLLAPSASTIKGLAGNDTVQINDDVASAKSVFIDMAGGADVLTASGADFLRPQFWAALVPTCSWALTLTWP